MRISKNQYYTLFLAALSFLLLFIVFKQIDYLSLHNYVVECFELQQNESSNTTHTVNLPLTTSYSCKNFCGPTSRCSITGQQCFADIDCPGCQPYVPPLKKSAVSIPGDDDAGKLTLGVTPQYSQLTSGYGTKERKVGDFKSPPLVPNFGINVWRSKYNEEKKLFDQRYIPSGLQFMPNYPERYDMLGEFIEDGPLPSNYQVV
jgi:hypothetical protein